jgi:hypothetical protein
MPSTSPARAPRSGGFPKGGSPSPRGRNRRSISRASQTTSDNSKRRSQIIAPAQAIVRTTPNRIVATRQGTLCASRRSPLVAALVRPAARSASCIAGGAAGSEAASEDRHAALTPRSSNERRSTFRRITHLPRCAIELRFRRALRRQNHASPSSSLIARRGRSAMVVPHVFRVSVLSPSNGLAYQGFSSART